MQLKQLSHKNAPAQGFTRTQTKPHARCSARCVRANHGHKSGPPPKGYLGDLRRAAIQLHSKEQLQKKKDSNSSASNGDSKPQQEQQQQKQQQFEPKVLGYLRFLQESKLVFDCIEGIVADAKDPSLTPFKQTGLERGSALAQDIQWLCNSKSLEPLAFKADGPGNKYVRRLNELAASDVPAFMCHFYNINFAHMAGGRMIGKAVSDRLLDGADLAFYQYEGDSKELGDKVKEAIEAVAQTWSEEDRKRSVDQTSDAFAYSGAMLKCITQACDCDCPRDQAEPAVPTQELATA